MQLEAEMKEESYFNQIAQRWNLTGQVVSVRPYGNGHINGTYLVETVGDATRMRYILQRINRNVFVHPEEVMENMVRVTDWLRRKIVIGGGDPQRETLCVRFTSDGMSFYRDESGEYYRLCDFVEDTVCLDQVRSREEFYESARTFGHFQHLLSDFPAQTLHETIPHFHDTRMRLLRFEEAVRRDRLGRAKEAAAEIAFTREHGALASELLCRESAGLLPVRVTHNDAKLNNVLYDRKSGKGLCVIDLDTVMPGLAVNDFGDSIRFGASTAAEDEPDLSLVHFHWDLYEAYREGFLDGCQGALTEAEVAALPLGAKTMTYECGIRFLTDYLEGDVYFKTDREGQNMDRCRTQYRLLEEIEARI